MARIESSLSKKRFRDQETAFVKRLQIEQDTSERLLLNILPRSIAFKPAQSGVYEDKQPPDQSDAIAEVASNPQPGQKLSLAFEISGEGSLDPPGMSGSYEHGSTTSTSPRPENQHETAVSASTGADCRPRRGLRIC